MPVAMERALKKSARKKGLTGKSRDAYVYGTMMRETNWRPPQSRKGFKKRKG